MADALSDNFCSLCGYSFYRFGSDSLNIKTSLASPVVEESGLLNKLKIAISPIKKELVFICFACQNVFSNYNTAKTNFELRERQALNLLTGPVEVNVRGQLPFVPYLKRKCLLGSNSDVPQDRPLKIQKVDNKSYIPQFNNECSGSREVEIFRVPAKECFKEPVIEQAKEQVKEEAPVVLPTDSNNLIKAEGHEVKAEVKVSKTKRIRQEAMKFVERGRYRSAQEKLWRNSRKFRRCCKSLISLVVRKETSNLVKKQTLFTRSVDVNDIGEVNWESTIQTVSQVAPTTLCLILALLGCRSGNIQKQVETKKVKENVVGSLLSQTLYKRFKRRASFLPQLHSLYLHQTCTHPQVQKVLHPLGLTIPGFRLAAILKERESLVEEPVVAWKKNLETALEAAPTKPDALCKKHALESKPVISYGLCWGRLQPSRLTQDGHMSSSPREDTNTPSMAQAYAALNRVPFDVMPKHNDVRAADNIPFEEFVPDSEDFLMIREQMEREVQKILVKYLSLFEGLPVAEGHQHSHAMAQKSNIVEVGSPFLHPTNHGSAASALKRLGGYMGRVRGEPVPLVVYGGLGAMEKAVGAKDVMSCFSDKADRLDGLEPATTDYSRDVLMSRHILEKFFPGNVTRQQWLVDHLCLDPSLLKQCDGGKDVMATRTFLTTLTHCYTLALGEERLAGVRLGKIGLCSEDKSRVMERIAVDIVADIWPRIDSAALDVVRQGTDSFKDRDCSYEDCVNYSEGSKMACSERCGRPFFLCCRAHLGDGLVECARRENCRRGAWFHINRRCSGLLKAPRDDWLCRWCAPRRGHDDTEDDINGPWEYHRGLLWYCLMLLVGRTAEAQGNGWLQHALWKVAMPLFDRHNYTHYLHQGYSFLSGVAGRIPRLAAHDMVHNRTVNLRGGTTTNLSWDRAVWLLNREARQGGSESSGDGTSRIPPSWSYSLRTAWERDICRVPKVGRPDPFKLVPDVAAKLCMGKTLRNLTPYPVSFIHNPHVITVENPKKLVDKLKELCRQDAKRQINEREGEVLELE